MAHQVKHLIYKHEDLSLDPKPDIVVCLFVSSWYDKYIQTSYTMVPGVLHYCRISKGPWALCSDKLVEFSLIQNSSPFSLNWSEGCSILAWIYLCWAYMYYKFFVSPFQLFHTLFYILRSEAINLWVSFPFWLFVGLSNGISGRTSEGTVVILFIPAFLLAGLPLAGYCTWTKWHISPHGNSHYSMYLFFLKWQLFFLSFWMEK